MEEPLDPTFQLGTTTGPKGAHEVEIQGHCGGLTPARSSQGNQLYLNAAKRLKP